MLVLRPRQHKAQRVLTVAESGRQRGLKQRLKGLHVIIRCSRLHPPPTVLLGVSQSKLFELQALMIPLQSGARDIDCEGCNQAGST